MLGGLILAAAAFALASCQIEIAEHPSGEFQPSEPGRLVVATEQVPAPGFWAGTVDEPDGGFEYELARAMADRFGLDEIEIRTVPFRDMIEGDLAGADIGLRQLTPTAERDRHLDFSIPYLSSPPAALVGAGTRVPDLKTARELSWAVAEGTTLVAILEEQISPEETVVTRNRRAALFLLRSGKVDAVLLDLPVALALADASDGELDVAAQFHGDEALAVALPQGSPNREAVNSAIRALTADRTIADLAGDWLGTSLQSTSFSVPDVPLIR